jgi:RNA polymerase sigma-70 factor (ECF subfamily)
MDENEVHSRISRIDTVWTLVREAHQGRPDEVNQALEALIRRYQGAIYRYLLSALRQADAADEVFQEFALRLVQGRFHRADPSRGRFRDFLKTCLRHLISDYRGKQRPGGAPLPSDSQIPETGEDDAEKLDQDFVARWREEVLSRTWEALARVQAVESKPYHTVLRYRAEHPQASSGDMARSLGAELGRPLTEVGVRQLLHRARERFADLLLEEVGRGLPRNDPEALRQELEELGLLPYCQSVLARRFH